MRDWSRRSAAAFVTACLLSLAAPAGAADNGTPIARVIQQDGSVAVQRGDDSLDSHLGRLLFAGDRVVTSGDGRVLIEFPDRSRLSLGADTQVVLDDYSLAPGPGRLKGFLSLLAGILRMSIVQSTRAEDFGIRTPTAIASVRSTDWIVEAGAGDTQVFVVSGLVRVSDPEGGGPVELAAGEGTDVKAGAAPRPASVWGAARAADVLKRAGF